MCRESMRHAVTEYLDFAAKTKRNIRGQAWNWMGVRNVGSEARMFMYWFMALVYGIIGVASIIVEDFPGGIQKP